MKRFSPLLLLFLAFALTACFDRAPQGDGATPVKIVAAGRLDYGEPASPLLQLVAGQPIYWVVEYTLDAALPAGAQVRVLFPHSYYNNRPANLLPQLDDPAAPGFCRLRVNGNETALQLADTALYPRHLIAVAPPQGWAIGDKLTFTFGGGVPFRAPFAANQSFAPFLVVAKTPGGQFEMPRQTGEVAVVAGNAAQTKLVAPAIIAAGEPFQATLTLLDEFGNPTNKAELSSLELYDGDRQLDVAAGDLDPLGFVRLGPLALEGPDRVVRLHVRFASGLPPATSNPIELTIAQPKMRVYFGDVHGHSIISDGARTPGAWYATAKGPAALDFAVLTDHEWQIEPTEWEQIRSLCVSETGERFTALLAWEYSLGGHGIVYYPDCDAPPAPPTGDVRDLWQVALNGARPVSWQMVDGAYRLDYGYKPALWERIHREGALYIAHTTATQDMGDEVDLDDPDVVRTIEVYSGHGSDFSADTTLRVPNFAPDGTVLAMLARGRHIALVAASDTHDSRPGLATWGFAPGGLTAVTAPSLARSDLFAAIAAGRTVATTGNRSLVHFTVDDHGPGERFAASSTVKLRWTVHGDGPLAKIEIWRNGEIWFAQNGDDRLDIEAEANDERLNGPTWYLLRAELVDGGRVWTSPIFVDDAERLVLSRFVALDAGDKAEIDIVGTVGSLTETITLLRRHGDDGGPVHEGYERVAEIDLAAGQVNYRDNSPIAPGLTTYYLLEEAAPGGAVRIGPIALVRYPESRFADGVFRFPAYQHGTAATVLIRDLDGRILRRIELPAKKGLSEVTWDRRDEQGKPINSLAFYRIEQGPYYTRWRPLIPPAVSRSSQ